MVNPHLRNLLIQFLADDDDMVLVLWILRHWQRLNSHQLRWLLRRRLTLQRIVQQRRIGVLGYMVDVIPFYHNVQFFEHFRMSRSTFEVT